MDFFYDKIPYVLTLGSIFAMGLLFSCTIVGRVLRNDEIQETILSEENIEKMKKRFEQKKYERSFYDELESIENRNLTKEDMEKLSTLYITEETPTATIKMCYSCETETFWYYSKNKHISYPTLDAVARKYAIEYNCSQICVNYRKEVENVSKKNAMIKKKSSEMEKENKDKPSIYVKLKSYNKTNTDNKKAVTVERSNRFTYKGTIEDIENIINNKIHETNDETTMKQISFAEYKKKMESQKKND